MITLAVAVVTSIVFARLGFAWGKVRGQELESEFRESSLSESAAWLIAHSTVPPDDPDFLLALEIEAQARDVERSIAADEGPIDSMMHEHRDRLWQQASDMHKRARDRAEAIAKGRLMEAKLLGNPEEPDWNLPHDYRSLPTKRTT